MELGTRREGGYPLYGLGRWLCMRFSFNLDFSAVHIHFRCFLLCTAPKAARFNNSEKLPYSLLYLSDSTRAVIG